jgi:hypothetical protein
VRIWRGLAPIAMRIPSSRSPRDSERDEREHARSRQSGSNGANGTDEHDRFLLSLNKLSRDEHMSKTETVSPDAAAVAETMRIKGLDRRECAAPTHSDPHRRLGLAHRPRLIRNRQEGSRRYLLATP